MRRMRWLLVVMILTAIVFAVQASMISGESQIHCDQAFTGCDLSLTFTSDNPTDQITSANLEMGSGGAAYQSTTHVYCSGNTYLGTPLPNLPSPLTPPYYHGTLTLVYSGLYPTLVSHYCDGVEVLTGLPQTITAVINENCPLTGSYHYVADNPPADTGDLKVADFSGTCPNPPVPAPEFPTVAIPITILGGVLVAIFIVKKKM